VEEKNQIGSDDHGEFIVSHPYRLACSTAIQYNRCQDENKMTAKAAGYLGSQVLKYGRLRSQNYFLNLRRTTTSPNSPVPSRSMVAGSGLTVEFTKVAHPANKWRLNPGGTNQYR
jgi:hypothetical protein